MPEYLSHYQPLSINLERYQHRSGWEFESGSKCVCVLLICRPLHSTHTCPKQMVGTDGLAVWLLEGQWLELWNRDETPEMTRVAGFTWMHIRFGFLTLTGTVAWHRFPVYPVKHLGGQRGSETHNTALTQYTDETHAETNARKHKCMESRWSQQFQSSTSNDLPVHIVYFC